MALKRASSGRPLDVVVAGLSVVDVIGRPIKISHLPKRGGLQYLDTVMLTSGGNVCNFGIDLAKLGFRVGAITRVGNDGLGEYLRSQFKRYRIDTTGVTIDPMFQTSSTIVFVDPTGERTFLHTRGCLKNFRPADVLRQTGMIRKSRILAFGYLGLLPECEPGLGRLFASVKKRTGVAILLDTGGTPKRNPRMLAEALPHVDYFLPSHDEAADLTGARSLEGIVRACRDAGASGVVGIKLGKKGCYMSWQGRSKLIPAKKVRTVLDATGAGDAFVSGFLAGVLKGYDPFASAKLGNAVAASCITAVGASTAIRPLSYYV